MTDSQKLWLIEKILDPKIQIRVISMTSFVGVELQFIDAGGNLHHQALASNGRLFTFDI